MGNLGGSAVQDQAQLIKKKLLRPLGKFEYGL